MDITELLTGLLLVLESILAVACFLAALEMRLLRRGRPQGSHWKLGEHYLTELRQLAAVSLKYPQLKAKLQNLKERVHQQREEGGIIAVLDHVLNVPPGLLSLDTVVAQQLSREERGAVGLCTLLTRAGPLTGLAGMLAGVAQALSVYLASGSAPQVFIAGFAGSIKATFWGVMIAILALVTTRRLWLPHLERVRTGLLEQATTAITLLATIRSRRPPEGSSPSRRRPQPAPAPSNPAAVDQAMKPSEPNPLPSNPGVVLK